MKQILTWIYKNIVVFQHYNMWKLLRQKKIAQNPLHLYRAKYILKRWLGNILSARAYCRQGLFLSVHIETIAYCNRKCKFCLNNDKFPDREQGLMSLNIWKKIINELSEIGYCGKISPYYYGEPLLDKRLCHLISYARKKCPLSFIQVNSNGDFLTEKLLVDLIRSGVDKILVTNYYGVGVKKKSRTAIMKDTERLEYLTKKYPQFVKLRNWKDIEFVNRIGLIRKGVNPRKNEPCHHPFFELVIDWKGNVILCCNDYYSECIIGNVAQDSIVATWKAPRFDSFRRLLRAGEREKIKICAGCDGHSELPVEVRNWIPKNTRIA